MNLKIQLKSLLPFWHTIKVDYDITHFGFFCAKKTSVTAEGEFIHQIWIRNGHVELRATRCPDYHDLDVFLGILHLVSEAKPSEINYVYRTIGDPQVYIKRVKNIVLSVSMNKLCKYVGTSYGLKNIAVVTKSLNTLANTTIYRFNKSNELIRIYKLLTAVNFGKKDATNNSDKKIQLIIDYSLIE